MRLTRRHPEPPPRDPHPNPRVEVQLQQIISMRRAAGRNEDMLDDYRRRITGLNDHIAKHVGSDYLDRRRNEVERSNTEIKRLNRETAEIHDQIRELCAKLADDDLLWLDPSPARRHASGGQR